MRVRELDNMTRGEHSVWGQPQILHSRCLCGIPRGLVGFRPKSDGFTLVELLVVISIIGLLIGITLPAVQQSREAGRRISCVNNLKNLGLALQEYEAAHGFFPPGNWAYRNLNHSWLTFVLPHLEMGSLYHEINLDRPWYEQPNFDTTNVPLSVLTCPSSRFNTGGETDYAGITGTPWTPAATWENVEVNGVLVVVEAARITGVSPGAISDGLSNTILVCESADRAIVDAGRWADGNGVFVFNGRVKTFGEFYGLHPGGVNVLMCDGSVHFLTEQLPSYVVGALCTRDGGESPSSF